MIIEGNRLDRVLAARREQGQAGLIIYITAGYPDLDTTARMLPALFAAGADVVEVGVPFSDPMADGPTIQRAAQRALAGGVRMADVLTLLERLRRDGLDGACLMLSYANTLLANGFLADPAPLAAAGFDGLIVPDIPAVEGGDLAGKCAQAGLYLIPFLTPTSPDQQIRAVAGGQGGFVYCVSVTGVTGRRQQLPGSTIEWLKRARSYANRPLALGFGISGPEQAAQLAQYCDAIIVGSALIDRIDASPGDPVGTAVSFVRELRAALDGD